jgi:glyoxylase-like metal-dependent hydrolase (beta-lactamase superfamily II)
MYMHEVAPDVFLLRGFPRYGINVYFTGGVLIDSGVRYNRWNILHELRNRQVRLHVLTHAHPDHQGASHAVCNAFGIPLWCGTGDAGAMEQGTTRTLLPDSVPNRLLDYFVAGPGHRVARLLREGDVVGRFTVIEAPGHTPGHLALWREADATLLLGDVVANNHPLTQHVGLREPNRRFTLNPRLNRQSARTLAELRPRIICFGHGPPLYDGAQFCAFVESLPN